MKRGFCNPERSRGIKHQDHVELSCAQNYIFSTMWIVALILLTLSSAWLICMRLRRRRHFWKRLGVEQCDNPNVLFGDHPMSNAAVVLGKTSVYDGTVDLYSMFKKTKYFGVYGFPSSPPILVVKDLDLLNHILGEPTRCTGPPDRMSHRKWRESKQQLIDLIACPGCLDAV